ncbi:Membrane carboxypeptidase (Penicillin-binding protein) [Nitrospina gracilis 3/211]|uniref:Membrane carboxypeptidase (Penicillin-binding protein) n=1 Tax=Nitrospina gracilis (strain 3/211) TaxID=1266370 RepID=M1ZE47_NITG3|nr:MULTISPECIES: PBP1A family penicillin-binding protein [Nitrospina]MCF8724632.1 penicillin-binding protein 1A [Nitrospina sp. Nb-3]CCQ91813.1 Membrane carboxypeptidase (Penicillin-binding protein) [Nitrospina gracilis 3/211]
MLRSILEKTVFVLYTLLVLFVCVAAGVYWNLRDDLPQLPDSLEKINLSLPTEIYSADGEIIKVLGQRHPVNLENISPLFLKAIIAVEDSRFYQHSGLDHIGLARALYVNLQRRAIVQGGSTLTQQLAKNLFFSFERDWVRKVKELLVALQMETTFTKNEILEAYCNQVYFGSGAYGVEEAAQEYFAKRAQDLNLLQAAMLAGLPNSPNNANPFINPERAMRRTQAVLARMEREGYISRTDREKALQMELGLVNPRIESNPNQYFVRFVIDKLAEDYGKEFVHYGGLKIYTTLDTRFQQLAHRSVETHLKYLEKRELKSGLEDPLQAALVMLDNRTGAIRALLGGRNYSESQFNRAVSNNRMPGSAFKPIVYMAAFEKLGYHPATVVEDEPTRFPIPGSEPWEPSNFGNKYMGPVILKKALMNSLNTVSAKLVYNLTPRRVIQTARQFGITSPLGDNLSLALGTSGVSPLEMAAAYSVIANQGILNEPYFVQRIEDFRGNVLYQHFFHGVQRFSSKTVYPLLNMMQGVMDEGTGRVVRQLGFHHPSGGKTGTTNDYKDAWFIGFTKEYAASVWVGYDNNQPVIDKNGNGLTGSRGAAPIWAYFMDKALEGKGRVNFPKPEGIKFQKVDTKTGYLPDLMTMEEMEIAVKEELNLEKPVTPETEVIPPVPPDREVTTVPAPMEDDALPKL